MTERRVVFADPDLPHQIVVIMQQGQGIGISCNCLRTKYPNGAFHYDPIEYRQRWDSPFDPMRSYRAWHAERGIDIPEPEIASKPPASA